VTQWSEKGRNGIAGYSVDFAPSVQRLSTPLNTGQRQPSTRQKMPSKIITRTPQSDWLKSRNGV
jgi:hypothetical protein